MGRTCSTLQAHREREMGGGDSRTLQADAERMGIQVKSGYTEIETLKTRTE